MSSYNHKSMPQRFAALHCCHRVEALHLQYLTSRLSKVFSTCQEQAAVSVIIMAAPGVSKMEAWF